MSASTQARRRRRKICFLESLNPSMTQTKEDSNMKMWAFMLWDAHPKANTSRCEKKEERE